MVHLWLRAGVLIVASSLCFAQTSVSAPTSGQNPPQLPTLGPQLPPPLLIAPEPPPLPLLPDAPLPDLATLTSPPPKSRVKRKLAELVPSALTESCTPAGPRRREMNLRMRGKPTGSSRRMWRSEIFTLRERTIARRLIDIRRHLYISRMTRLRSEEHTSELQSRGHLVC